MSPPLTASALIASASHWDEHFNAHLTWSSQTLRVATTSCFFQTRKWRRLGGDVTPRGHRERVAGLGLDTKAAQHQSHKAISCLGARAYVWNSCAWMCSGGRVSRLVAGWPGAADKGPRCEGLYFGWLLQFRARRGGRRGSADFEPPFSFGEILVSWWHLDMGVRVISAKGARPRV